MLIVLAILVVNLQSMTRLTTHGYTQAIVIDPHAHPMAFKHVLLADMYVSYHIPVTHGPAHGNMTNMNTGTSVAPVAKLVIMLAVTRTHVHNTPPVITTMHISGQLRHIPHVQQLARASVTFAAEQKHWMKQDMTSLALGMPPMPKDTGISVTTPI
jgi:hypothetical protein